MLPQPATETIKVEPSRLRLLIKGRQEGADRWEGDAEPPVRTLGQAGVTDCLASVTQLPPGAPGTDPPREHLHLVEAGPCGIVVKEISFEDWV